jgi:plastocyanin
MKHTRLVGWMLAMAVIAVPQVSVAQVTWNAKVGAEANDQSVQADAFLANELWILEGDSVRWKFVPKNEIHTVTLLAPGQVRPPFPVGCPPAPPSGVQPSGSSYSGAACVNSGPMAGGVTYTVKFPTPGNFKLVCLVHTDMNGTIHVLPTGAALPHDQAFYDDLARDETAAILADHDDHDGQRDQDDQGTLTNAVTAGVGEIVATGGGRQYRSVVRFLKGTIHVHVGETVEWTNLDPTEPHTVTFGTEPMNPMAIVGATPAADGALQGTITSATDSVSSGFLAAAPQDQIGSPQQPPGTTRIRITFTKPGTYNYICALHDVDGMVGQVIVSR